LPKIDNVAVQSGFSCENIPRWYTHLPQDEDYFTQIWGTPNNGIIAAHILDKPGVVGVLGASNGKFVGGTLLDIPKPDESKYYSVPVVDSSGQVTMYVYVNIANCGPDGIYMLPQFGIPQTFPTDFIPDTLA
jgi:hypothetical protein